MGARYTIDLSNLENKELMNLFEAGKNEFHFTYPSTGT